MKELIFETLVTFLKMEVSNEIFCDGNGIIVALADGTKAKITLKNLT